MILKSLGWLLFPLFLSLSSISIQKNTPTHVEAAPCVCVGRGDVAVDVWGSERGEGVEVAVVGGIFCEDQSWATTETNRFRCCRINARDPAAADCDAAAA